MGYQINRQKMPTLFPTNRHQPEFWEALGRTIGTFGFLELILAQAIFALTGTRKFSDQKECAERFEKWITTLEHALYDPLSKLADSYSVAAKAHQNFKPENVEGLVSDIKKAAEIRNVLAHGAWGLPDETGKSTPFFVNRHKEKFSISIDVDWLLQIQKHVADLALDVMDSVTVMGLQFPGTNGPGNVVWKR